MQLLAFLLLFSTTASAAAIAPNITIAASSFDLIAHRQHDCFRHTSKFVCFGIGYGNCCQHFMRADRQLLVGFLSMSQSSTVGGDIIVVHKRLGTDGCGGSAVGSNPFGCANAELGIAFGGRAHSCTGNCNKRSTPACEEAACEKVHLADAVFYEGLAYDAQPTDSRLGELIDKISLDDVLSKSELQELEPLRMPFADIQKTPSPDGSKDSK